MENKSFINKIIAITIIVTVLFPMIVAILPSEVVALNEVVQEEGQAEDVTRNYEIKEEEEWDISKEQNGSVKAKWTREDRTLTISGTGERNDWKSKTQYINSIENVIIKEGITTIDDYEFRECINLKRVEIPDSVSEIGSNAFEGCSSLTQIKIPKNVTDIGLGAFDRM